MRGINSSTGKAIEGTDHLQQSIADILGTRIGTRVMRRDYGSRLPELVDSPMNEEAQIEIFAATAEALQKWEPRFRLERVSIEDTSEHGKLVISLSGMYVIEGDPVTVTGIEIGG